MKRILTILAALGIALSASADEGMWLLPLLQKMNGKALKEAGCKLSPEEIYSINHSSLKDNIIHFGGGCTGEIISADGLIVTNHHCGYSSIQALSTDEHNYLMNGYWAMTREQELPAKGLSITFLQSMTDVTAALEKAEKKIRKAETDEQAIAKKMQEERQALIDKAVQANKNCTAQITSFYNDNVYYLIVYKTYRDVRFVGAPPASVGKFGGETDNWMWPRQTCDFSVFRIYADPKTNGPAEYSEQNVPYHPEHWARVSEDGYSEGDFAMTMGYPGSTSRYLSSYGIEERYVQNDLRQQVRGVKQQVMKRHMDASEAVRIKYDSKYAHSSNYWKNSIGMNKCIDSIGLIQQKRDFEERLRLWQQQTGHYAEELDFPLLEHLYKERIGITRAWMLFTETFRGTDDFSSRAMYVHNGAKPVGHGKRQHINIKHLGDKWDYDTDREILVTLINKYREQMAKYPELKKYLPECLSLIDTEYGGDCQAYADALYKESILMKVKKKKETVRVYPNKKSFYKDMGVKYGLDLTDAMHKMRQDMEKITDSIDVQEQWLCAAKLRMEEGLPHYSDANFTMRMSYGQVKEYTLGGRPSGWQTKAPSMVEKMKKGDSIEDYKVEPEMIDLLSNAGQMPLCFLTTNDITGGNSGSPMFDGQNRLIGLAFDGNWDSLSSDIFFDSQLARCIGVDIRYVLFMMDRWGHADRLLEEIHRNH